MMTKKDTNFGKQQMIGTSYNILMKQHHFYVNHALICMKIYQTNEREDWGEERDRREEKNSSSEREEISSRL